MVYVVSSGTFSFIDFVSINQVLPAVDSEVCWSLPKALSTNELLPVFILRRLGC
jgi:hypothetical protein